ncbi:MAG: putative bifunctional diguanylate cyclase/phosphodiesterase [Acidimicrobiales bacterium]
MDRRWGWLGGLTGTAALMWWLGGAEVRSLVVAVVAGLAALAAGYAGIRQRRNRAGWLAVALGLSANAIGDAIFTVSAWRNELNPPFPGVADGFYLALYPLMGLGLWLLVRKVGQERTALIDAAIVAVGATVVIWEFLVAPMAEDASATMSARLVSGAYPVGDLILVALLARLVFVGGANGPLRLLAVGVGALFVADVAYLSTELYGSFSSGSWVDALYVASYVFIGYAALLPPPPPPPPSQQAPAIVRRHGGLSWARLALLTAMTLVAPAVASSTGDGISLPIVASAVLFLLVMIRVAGLLRTLSQSGARRFEALVAKSSVLVAIIDGAAVRYASPSMLHAAGLGSANGSLFTLSRLVHPDDIDLVGELLRAAETQPAGGSARGEFRICQPDGSWRVVAAVATNHYNDADINGIVLNAHNIDELRRLASFDPLTGLANRNEFTQRLERAMAGGGELTLTLLDLDGFKEINDSLGHQAGDSVLVEAAQRLREVVGPGELVARLGGDEFAILGVGAGVEGARRTAERALLALLRPIAVDAVSVGVGASLGLVHRPPPGAALPGAGVPDGAASGSVGGPSELLRCADIAMYQAKQQGRGRVVSYEPSMSEPIRRRLELRAALEHAVARGEMDVHYQPLCALDDGAVLGFEALLRWHHPQGPIAPAEFIPAAEESHHIVTLGRWVLAQAIAQLGEWQQVGGAGASLSMSVNLSPRQVHDPHLVDTIAGLLAKHAVAPSCLVLEITEAAVVSSPAAAVGVFARLKQLGVRLSVDDYGSGNASISYLRQFPIDQLKIDRSLISTVVLSRESRALVKSILELAAALRLEVVAEGIETAAQRETLQELGAVVGQGMLLGPPKDRAETTHLLGVTGWRIPRALAGSG